MSDDSYPDDQIIEETDENFRPTGIEFEEKFDEAPIRPYDPEQIRVDPKMFSLRQVLDMIDEGDLELAPDFQRLRVWSHRQKCRLIESVLLRIPLPAFYFSSDESGGLQVVDGLQRLSTIHDFVRGGKDRNSSFALEGLEYLQTQLGGRDFQNLNSTLWIRRINNTQIVANVIDPQTPHRVKFDIFQRINTGGSPLNSQEIRHCLSKQKSRDLLKRLSSTPDFINATGGTLLNNVRMVDREVVLRFCAFHQYPGRCNYRQHSSMDDFLNQASQMLDDISPEASAQMESDFANAMRNTITIFGPHSFRKWSRRSNRLSPFNRALFDVWSVLLVAYDINQITLAAPQIVSAARDLMTTDDAFNASISAGTSDARKVDTRFQRIQNLLESAIP